MNARVHISAPMRRRTHTCHAAVAFPICSASKIYKGIEAAMSVDMRVHAHVRVHPHAHVLVPLTNPRIHHLYITDMHTYISNSHAHAHAYAYVLGHEHLHPQILLKSNFNTPF